MSKRPTPGLDGIVRRDYCDCGAEVQWDIDVTQSHQQIADVATPTFRQIVEAFDLGRPVYRYESDHEGNAWMTRATAVGVLDDIRRGYRAMYRLAHECPRLPRGHREPA